MSSADSLSRLTVSLVSGGRGRTAQTYDEVVKDLIMSEKSYLRDLHMITKVFREQILRLPPNLASNQELDAIFSNINDITELTITLIGSLEDTLEMAEDGQVAGQLSSTTLAFKPHVSGDGHRIMF